MLFGDKECNLIGYFQTVKPEEKILFLPRKNKNANRIIELISDYENCSEWIDSSGKSDPPPDFYCPKYHIMMDVMRVDDKERKGKKGKLYNPTKQRERKLYNELIKKNPTIKDADVFINGITNLNTYEDHNYTFYKNNFKRVLKKHINNIPLYKKNHPGYKLIFFVFDESTAYLQAPYAIDKNIQHFFGEIVRGDPHLYYQDADFLDVFCNSPIDYLIWCTPYKLIDTIETPPYIPKICIFDLSKNHFKMKRYLEQHMESLEL